MKAKTWTKQGILARLYFGYREGTDARIYVMGQDKLGYSLSY